MIESVGNDQFLYQWIICILSLSTFLLKVFSFTYFLWDFQYFSTQVFSWIFVFSALNFHCCIIFVEPGLKTVLPHFFFEIFIRFCHLTWVNHILVHILFTFLQMILTHWFQVSRWQKLVKISKQKLGRTFLKPGSTARPRGTRSQGARTPQIHDFF